MMFPGAQGPKALPDGESHKQFWSNFHRFLAVSAVTISFSLFVRHCERRTSTLLFAGV
ncbi:hypothetical protein C3747_9g393 [Trypanosoma cruzi]|uniref:Uncharacterized protein n=1 Tax=Trypanosoma cruzi TaxID=5693 RepID=A0A2V2XL84_TRYCR|nr:hypothetical protein C3747_9g393 [Trypanosoma cruzi]